MPDETNPARKGQGGEPVSILDQGDAVYEPDPPRRPRKTREKLEQNPSEPPRERPEDDEIDAPEGADEPLDEPSGAPGGGGGDDEAEDEGAPSEEASEGDEPEPGSERERPIRADAKVRLRDGTELTVGDLKRNHEERQAYEARLIGEYNARAQAIEAERQRNAQLNQQLQQQLQQVVAVTQAGIPPEPDPSLRESDPFRFQQEWIDRERAIRQWHQRNQQLQQVTAQQQAQFQHQHASVVAGETETLFRKVPDLRQPERMKVFRQQAHEVLVKNYGFTPEEIDGNPDHRVVLAYRDLIEFHKWKAERAKGKEALKQKTAGAPPVQRPQPNAARIQNGKAARGKRTADELRRISRDPNASPADKRRAGEDLLSLYEF